VADLVARLCFERQGHEVAWDELRAVPESGAAMRPKDGSIGRCRADDSAMLDERDPMERYEPG